MNVIDERPFVVVCERTSVPDVADAAVPRPVSVIRTSPLISSEYAGSAVRLIPRERALFVFPI